MPNFIEVTSAATGKKHLINLAWIEEIRKDTSESVTIYLAFTSPNSYEQDYLRVRESYEEIKRKVGAEDGKPV